VTRDLIFCISIRISILLHCVRLTRLLTMCKGALLWQKIDQNRSVTAGSHIVPELKTTPMFFSLRLTVCFRRWTLSDPKLNLRNISEDCQANFLNMHKIVKVNNTFLLVIERRFWLGGEDSFLQNQKHRTCPVYWFGTGLNWRSFQAYSQNCAKRPLLSSCLCVCPSARQHGTTRLLLTDFYEILHLRIFRKSLGNWSFIKI
jgi:hypothetical protein